MSLNSNKITVCSSPQAQYLTTCPTGTTDLVVAESSVNRVPKRTTYRVKITNSKDFEVLSTAAKLGLNSWVGGQKVRIVGVAPKQSSEFAAAKSQVAISESCSLPADANECNSSKAGFAPCPAEYPFSSVTNWNYSSISGEQRQLPGCYAASVAVVSGPKSCTFSAVSDTGGSQSMHVVTGTPLQSCMTSMCQSSLASNHCWLGGSLATAAGAGMSSRSEHSKSLNSLVKPCESVVLKGLPRNVHYLGTVAVNMQGATGNSVHAGVHTHSDQNVTETSVISALNKFTEKLSGNKVLNGKHVNGPVMTCIKNNHMRKTHDQQLSKSQNSSAVFARCLKRSYVEDYTTSIVPNKRLAQSVKLPTDCVEACNFSCDTKSGTHRQPLTSNMLNQVAARQVNCGQYTGYSHCSAYDTVKNSQEIQEVNNNCSSQQSLVAKFRLSPGSDVLSSENDSSLQSFKLVLPSDSETCARLRPFNSTKKKYSCFTFLLSRHRVSDVRFDDNNLYNDKRRMELCDLPMAMRFRHLRQFCTETVTVHRSTIHGLGLFCLRGVSAGEMLMEYAGEVIRASVADVRERRYDAHGIGCYMFRCGDDNVVDATKCGNVARFINHSCDPNCYSRQIIIDGRVHIIIFALRDIRRGEELTYDYKFPIEEVKMPCLCKSRRCRKYLN